MGDGTGGLGLTHKATFPSRFQYPNFGSLFRSAAKPILFSARRTPSPRLSRKGSLHRPHNAERAKPAVPMLEHAEIRCADGHTRA